MNRKYEKQLQKVQAAHSTNQASISYVQSIQTSLEQEIMRLNLAQSFARQGVTRNTHPWPHLAGDN